MKYKTVNDIAARKIADSYILLSLGERALSHNEIIELSETGYDLWKHMEQYPCTKDELISCLLERYDVDETTAEIDVIDFIKQMTEAQLIIEIDDTKI